MNKSQLVVPQTASDVLLHDKDTDNTERIVLPFTRYGNVMHSPTVVSTPDSNFGAPFHILEVDTEKVPESIIRNITKSII